MRRQILSSIVLALTVAACSRSFNQPPNPNEVATQVYVLLTSIPTSPETPTPLPGIPPVTATANPIPQPTPLPTSTPLPIVTQTVILPTVTETAIATTVPTPITTRLVTDPTLTLGTPTHEDKMQNPGAWGIYTSTHASMQMKEGYLALTAKNPDGWTAWTLTPPKLINFYAEATLKPGNCSRTDHYGIAFRVQSSNQGYLFGVSCDQEFSMSRFDGYQFTPILDWTSSSAIANGLNRLGVMARGDQFTFYINGVDVGNAQESAYKEGQLGLFVTSLETSNFTVNAQELDYWVLP